MTEKKTEKKSIEFEVADPQELRPKELPLVIKPVGGKWANDAQAEFAKVLNGYAYKNPEKWATKKVALLAQLKELETNPALLNILSGNFDGSMAKVGYKNKLIEE
jgi:hypothetical protein